MNSYFYVEEDKYHYRIEGSGPVLALFHGFTSNMSTWDGLVDQLKDRFTLLRIDLPGHGKTVCKQMKTMKRFAMDFHSLLQSLEIEKCSLLGYSLGGRTALSIAQYHPHIVDQLLLESASPGLKTTEERHQRIKNDEVLASKIEKEGIRSFVDYWENIPLFQSQKLLDEKIQDKIRQERLGQSEAGLAMSLRAMGTGEQPSWWEHLSQLQTQTTLIVGALDTKFVTINKEMKKKLMNTSLFIVNEAGHCVHVEQVEKFGKIVMEQLKK